MKKSILNLGKALNKAEQKEVNGGLMAWSGKCLCPNGEVVNATGTGSSRKACHGACEGKQVCNSFSQEIINLLALLFKRVNLIEKISNIQTNRI